MPRTPRTKDKPKADAALKIIYYTDENGRDYFQEWTSGLRDYKAKEAIYRRIYRTLLSGNYGDSKPLRDGVRELRIDVGQGYRIYYAKDGLTIVLILCGGDKRSQNRDIDRACGFWREWQERKRKENKK